MIDKQIEKKINKVFMKVFNSIFTKGEIKNFDHNSIVKAKLKLQLIENSQQYQDFALKFSKELARLGLSKKRGVWKKYFEAAKKLRHVALPKNFTEYEKNIRVDIVQNNFKMITSIPEYINETFDKKYFQTLVEEVSENKIPRGSFEKQLNEHGFKHAKLVARTETAKLQSVVMEKRSTELGSVVYSWLASRDKRTRPSHREMEGVIVFWRPFEQKPLRDNMRGNAGEFPNCRCSPEPIVDIDELEDSNYKVYDYATDKIVNMSRKKLISAIENGKL